MPRHFESAAVRRRFSVLLLGAAASIPSPADSQLNAKP